MTRPGDVELRTVSVDITFLVRRALAATKPEDLDAEPTQERATG